MLPMLYDRSSGRSPVSLIEEMRRDMDRLMEQAFRDEWWPTARLGAGLPDGAPTWTPAVDIQETGKDYRLTVEAPGLDPDDLRVDVTGNVLTIAGEKKVERNEGEGRFRLAERRAGRFERSFPLPEHVDADRITAEFENGVLTVVVPRQADAKPRRIEIKSSPPNRFTRPLTCRAADRADDASQRRARPNDEEELYQADLRLKYESAA